ncbi:hypothetical protein CRENBAI_024776 [Crenichthys baileyi]|uniref:Uncharacterized protein n=1 Tax=Crenichthys baileyi TaxID=28760 RepID=A0AAV9REG1_9TELE
MSLNEHRRVRIRDFPRDRDTGGVVEARGGKEARRSLGHDGKDGEEEGRSSAEESMNGGLLSKALQDDWLKRDEDLTLIGWSRGACSMKFRGDVCGVQGLKKHARLSLVCGSAVLESSPCT